MGGSTASHQENSFVAKGREGSAQFENLYGACSEGNRNLNHGFVGLRPQVRERDPHAVIQGALTVELRVDVLRVEKFLDARGESFGSRIFHLVELLLKSMKIIEQTRLGTRCDLHRTRAEPVCRKTHKATKPLGIALAKSPKVACDPIVDKG